MSIAGTWFNELGSEMELTIDDKGSISGHYISKVGEAKGQYILVGRYDLKPAADHGTALGWSVSWLNDQLDANSVTSWSGQYLAVDEERIVTLWLLATETLPADLWESTLVGQDIFTRTAPSTEQVERRLRIGAASSHPLRQVVPRH